MKELMKSSYFRFVTSIITFGTIGLFVRNIEVSSGEIALYRAILAAITIGIFLWLSPRKVSFSDIKRYLPLLIVSGGAMGFNWILLFEAYNYTTVSVATLSYYFAPVIVTLVCSLLFRERMTAKKWICFVMATLGIVLITAPGHGTDVPNNGLGIALGLGAAVLYAVVILINKFALSVDGIYKTFFQFLAATGVLIPYVAMTGGTNLQALSATGWVCLLVLGIFHSGVAYCMYFSSLKDFSGQRVAVISYLDPLVAIIISVFVLGETITPMQILGGALVLGFALWNEMGHRE